jgi:hypothetical protein
MQRGAVNDLQRGEEDLLLNPYYKLRAKFIL